MFTFAVAAVCLAAGFIAGMVFKSAAVAEEVRIVGYVRTQAERIGTDVSSLLGMIGVNANQASAARPSNVNQAATKPVVGPKPPGG